MAEPKIAGCLEDVWDKIKARLDVPDLVERMVIDIQAGKPARVYYQCFASEDTLSVGLDFASGVAVVCVDPKVDDGLSDG